VKKIQILKHLPPTPPFFPDSTSLLISLPPPPERHRGMGNGVVVSSSHIVSAAPSSSGGGLLRLFPCSSVRSLSWETVLHKLLQHESFPWAAALHELPLRGSFPQGAVLQEQAAPVWVHHGVTSPASKPASVRASHGVTGSFRHPPAPTWGPFHGLQVDLCSTVDLHGLQGDNLPHHGLSHELQGKTLCFSICSTSSPSFFTDLGVCRIVSLTSSHSSLFTAVSLPVFFFPFLNMLSQRRYHCH